MTNDIDVKLRVGDRAAATTGVPHRGAAPATGGPRSAMGDDAAIVAEFERTGIVHLRGVFSDEDAAAMRESVWAGWADAYGVDRDDPATWTGVPAWKTIRAAKRDPSFRAILGPQLTGAADVLLGPAWSVPNGFGGLLASLPDATTWHLPGRDGLWHSDFGYLTPMDPLPSLRVFAVFGDVPPTGGGTLLVAGSHRMVERFVAAHPEMAARRSREARAACHRSNHWLAQLILGDSRDSGRIRRFMATETDVDSIPARVIEACGEPGDVFVCHPWTIHCRAPNASNRPRFLRSPTLGHRQQPPAE